MMAHSTYTVFASKMTIKKKTLWFVVFSNFNSVNSPNRASVQIPMDSSLYKKSEIVRNNWKYTGS